LGPATYQVPNGKGDWVDGLLVESEQSMANRLEATIWDDVQNAPIRAIADLPWVRVRDKDGTYLTSSRVEAHRLASAFVRHAKTADGTKMFDHIATALELQPDVPHDRPRMAAALMALDPLCLIHGVFFSDKDWLGQPKFPRALVAAIDARNVMPVHSGGVKTDNVSHKNKDGQGSSEGYGTVPFHRTEYTAEIIEAAFSIDRRQLVSYGLSAQGTDLLFALAQLEIALLLQSGLRLRTSCQFEVESLTGDELPSVESLKAQISELIAETQEVQAAEAVVTELVWDGAPK